MLVKLVTEVKKASYGGDLSMYHVELGIKKVGNLFLLHYKGNYFIDL